MCSREVTDQDHRAAVSWRSSTDSTFWPLAPDSIEFLVMRGAAWQEIRDLLVRISRTVNIAFGCRFVVNGEKNRHLRVWHLFSGKALSWQSFLKSYGISD